MSRREIKWFDMETDECLGSFPLNLNNVGDYVCPKCGKPAEYREGTIGQDRMGNDINGRSFDCYQCHIYSQAEEL